MYTIHYYSGVKYCAIFLCFSAYSKTNLTSCTVKTLRFSTKRKKFVHESKFVVFQIKNK